MDEPFFSKLAERGLPFLLQLFNYQDSNPESGADVMSERAKNQKKRMVTVCAHCQSELDEQGVWQSAKSSNIRHLGARLTHGICPACTREHFSELEEPDPQ